jgi:hypothetical protein
MGYCPIVRPVTDFVRGLVGPEQAHIQITTNGSRMEQKVASVRMKAKSSIRRIRIGVVHAPVNR